jgi:hypothetical protein
MGKHNTVSTKIPAELRAKMEKLEIKPSKELRKGTEDEVKRREAQELKAEVNRLKLILSKVSAEKAVKSVTEDKKRRRNTIAQKPESRHRKTGR